MSVRDRLTAVLLLVLLLAVGGFAWWLQLRPALTAAPASLAGIPERIDGWQARELPMDESIESMLRADFNVQRAYRHHSGEVVWLYVGYYGTERGGTPEHTPWACYRAHGYRFERERILEVDPGLRVNEAVVEQDGHRRLVFFWFRSYRRTSIVSPWRLSLDHLVGRLLEGRADGALVRLSTPLREGEESAARARLRSLASAVEKELATRWPHEAPAERQLARIEGIVGDD